MCVHWSIWISCWRFPEPTESTPITTTTPPPSGFKKHQPLQRYTWGYRSLSTHGNVRCASILGSASAIVAFLQEPCSGASAGTPASRVPPVNPQIHSIDKWRVEEGQWVWLIIEEFLASQTGFSTDFLLKVHTPRILTISFDLMHKSPEHTQSIEKDTRLLGLRLSWAARQQGALFPWSLQPSGLLTLYPIKKKQKTKNNQRNKNTQGLLKNEELPLNPTVQKNTDNPWICALSWEQWGATDGFWEIMEVY